MSYSINGQDMTRLHLVIGARGAWVCEFTLDTDGSRVTGAATLTIDELTLIGTVDDSHTGVFGDTKSGRVVGGANGWSKVLPPKDYANDAGVKAQSVVQDLITATGEKLGTFAPQSERIGLHYMRNAQSAAHVLDDVIGSALWWVDDAGVTHVGARATNTPAESAYEVTDYDVRSKRVELACDDLRTVRVGSVLTKTLDGPQVVRDLEIIVDGEQRTVIAWCGPAGEADRLSSLFRALIRHTATEQLFGVYRYRVIKMTGDRAELQAISKASGVPDLLPISQWPGIPGAHAVLTPGTEVLVGFVEGDRSQPYIQSYVGKGGPGHVPVEIQIGESGAPVARVGDAVEVLLPPMVFSGLVGGVPASGVLTAVMSKTLGTITAGSPLVKVGTP